MQVLLSRINSHLFGLTKTIPPLYKTTQLASSLLPTISSSTTSTIFNRCFGILSVPMNMNSSNFLKPITPMVNSVCGMKVKGKAKLRCKFCYFVWRKETLYVMCKAKPRHKQTQRRAKPHNYYILTHATQGKFRPW